MYELIVKSAKKYHISDFSYQHYNEPSFEDIIDNLDIYEGQNLGFVKSIYKILDIDSEEDVTEEIRNMLLDYYVEKQLILDEDVPEFVKEHRDYDSIVSETEEEWQSYVDHEKAFKYYGKL